MASRMWARTGWRARDASPAPSVRSDHDTFFGICLEEAAHATVARAEFKVAVRGVCANCKTLDGHTRFGSWGDASWDWPHAVVFAAGPMAAIREGLYTEAEYRRGDDYKKLRVFARDNADMIASAETGARALVDKWWEAIARVAAALKTRGAIDGIELEALISGQTTRATPARPAVTVRAAPSAGGSSARQVLTVKDAGQPIGEVWAIRDP